MQRVFWWPISGWPVQRVNVGVPLDLKKDASVAQAS